MTHRRRAGRPRQNLERCCAPLPPVQAAGLTYYSQTSSRDRTDILRHIVRTFILLDKNLDEEVFAAFVKEQLEPRYKDEPEMLATLRARVAELLEERAGIHEQP